MANISQQVNRQIKQEIYDSLRKSLMNPISSKSKVSWAENFIKEVLSNAQKDPTGPLGQLMAKQIMQEDIIASLDSDTEKFLARDRDFLNYRIYKQCYKEQRDVLLDDYSKLILVNTGRRTGKTNLAARWLVSKCIIPNSPTFYIHLKFDNAIRQCFDLCVESAKNIELGIERTSKAEGIIVFANGSSIKFCGNSNKSEADKLRGFKARGIVIDEAAFQINMNYLINDILTPLMADYSDSQMLLISTPPRIPHTYYEKCYRDNAWTKYEWYANKNPFIPSFDAFIEDLCNKKGLSKDSPFILREGYGQFVYDTEAQVFKNAQVYEEKPDFPIDHVYIGNDYGWAAYNAVVGVACNTHLRKGYVFFEEKFNKATVTDIIESNKRCLDEGKKLLIKYNAPLNNIRIYGDTSDTSIIQEMAVTYRMPASQCYKYDKETAITQLSEMCSKGQILIPKDGYLADEFSQIVYKRDEEDNILPEIDDTLYHGDIAMALLYASRQWAVDWGLEKARTDRFMEEHANFLGKPVDKFTESDTKVAETLYVNGIYRGRH